MTSTLGFAVLSVLARQPRTGYDLARLMSRPVGYFWSANHSQIYPELARLEEAALVEHEVVDRGHGPRPTKRYAVTPAGLAALRGFVAEELTPGPARDLETLKLWSIWTVEPVVARNLVRAALAAHEERLAAYRRERAEAEADPSSRDPSSPQFATRLTLEGGVRTRAAAVAWCRWMLTQLPGPADPAGLGDPVDASARTPVPPPGQGRAARSTETRSGS